MSPFLSVGHRQKQKRQLSNGNGRNAEESRRNSFFFFRFFFCSRVVNRYLHPEFYSAPVYVCEKSNRTNLDFSDYGDVATSRPLIPEERSKRKNGPRIATASPVHRPDTTALAVNNAAQLPIHTRKIALLHSYRSRAANVKRVLTTRRGRRMVTYNALVVVCVGPHRNLIALRMVAPTEMYACLSIFAYQRGGSVKVNKKKVGRMTRLVVVLMRQGFFFFCSTEGTGSLQSHTYSVLSCIYINIGHKPPRNRRDFARKCCL